MLGCNDHVGVELHHSAGRDLASRGMSGASRSIRARAICSSPRIGKNAYRITTAHVEGQHYQSEYQHHGAEDEV